jgi:hypothetical protein
MLGADDETDLFPQLRFSLYAYMPIRLTAIERAIYRTVIQYFNSRPHLILGPRRRLRFDALFLSYSSATFRRFLILLATSIGISPYRRHEFSPLARQRRPAGRRVAIRYQRGISSLRTIHIP